MNAAPPERLFDRIQHWSAAAVVHAGGLLIRDSGCEVWEQDFLNLNLSGRRWPIVQIRVGYELIYDCPQPIPMMLMLNIHHTRASDIVIPDHLTTTPSMPITAYRDIFGNRCNRIVAPKGQIRLASTAVVKDTGEPDVVVASVQQHSIQDLPEETLMFLLGSRYCETDLLSHIAWNLFGH